MIRLFLPPEDLTAEDIIIKGDNARHLALVMRVHPGETVTVFDGQEYRYECTILSCHKKEVIARIIKKEPYSVESPISITLAQGIAKGEKMDLIIQKATELGVSKIIPLITERADVKRTEKISRWRKIALSASQQSGRNRIPEILEPIDFRVFLSTLIIHAGGESPPGIIFSEECKTRNLRQVLSGFRDTGQVTLMVGPEGGFAKDEVTAAVEKGFIEASLGPRILRTETAPITAISIIQYELGDMA